MNARSIPGLTDEAGSFRQETGRSPALREIFPAASPRRTLLPLSATRLFFYLLPPPDDAFSDPPRAAHHSAASLLCRPRQTGHCVADARRASLPDHVCTANTLRPAAPLFNPLPQTPPCRRPCFRAQHRLKSFPCAFWTCSFFRQHPASAWGARLFRPPRGKAWTFPSGA